MLAKWWRGWQRSRLVSRPSRRRLTLEALEDRLAPAVATLHYDLGTRILTYTYGDNMPTAISGAGDVMTFNAGAGNQINLTGAAGSFFGPPSVQIVSGNLVNAGVEQINIVGATGTETLDINVLGNPIPGLNVNSAVELTNINANITTKDIVTNSIVVQSPTINVTQTTITLTTDNATNDGSIVLAAVNAGAATAHGLTLNPGSGAISLATVGSARALRNLVVNSSGNIQLAGNINVSGGGAVDFSAVTGNITLTSDVYIDTYFGIGSPGNILFGTTSSINGAFNLTLDTQGVGTGANTRLGNVGNITRLSSLKVVASDLDLFGNLLTNGPGGVDFDDITINVDLFTNVLIDTDAPGGASNAGPVRFGTTSTLNGLFSLTIDATADGGGSAADVTLGVVGSLPLPLTSLSVNAANLTNISTTFTSGSQTYDANVTVVGNGLTANNNPITFQRNLTVNGSAVLNAGTASVTFSGGGVQTLSTPATGSIVNLLHSGAGNLVLADNLLVTGNFTQAAGTFNSNGQNLDINGNLMITGGSFIAPSGTLNLGGNFFNGAGFVHSSGQFVLDGNDQTIGGDATFFALTKITATSVTLSFEDSTTQIVQGTLTLKGSAGQPLFLRSTTIGTDWLINPQGMRDVAFVDVQNSNNISGVDIDAFYSFDSGDNTDWNFPTYYIWEGTVNTDFSDGANWDFGAAPGVGDAVVILSAVNQPALTAPINIGALILATGTSLTLSGFNLNQVGEFSNDGTIVLRGTETITGLVQDTNSGTWEYVGDGTMAAITVRDFGATDYFNLRINSTNPGQPFQLGNVMNIVNNLTVLSGSYRANGQIMVVTGNTTISGGEYQTSTAGQVLNNLTVTGTGTLTGGTGLVTVNGNVVISGTATFTAPITNTVLGNWLKTAGATYNPVVGSTVNFSRASGTQTVEHHGDFRNFSHNAAGTLVVENTGLNVLGNFTQSLGTMNANGQTLTVGGNGTFSGGTYQTGNALHTFSGSLTISGTANLLSLGSIVFSVGGAFSRSGSGLFTMSGLTLFVTGNFSNTTGGFTSTEVVLNGTNQSISGSTTFARLTKTSLVADTLFFQAGSATTVNVALTLTGGGVGNELVLRSTSVGTQWRINPSGSRNVAYVDVQDSINENAAVILAASSIDSGSNVNWDFTSQVVTWTGASSTNWDVGANWSTAVPPNPTDSVIIPNVANQPVLATPVTINSLTLHAGTSLTLNGQNFIVNGGFSNDGTVILRGSETVTLVSQDANSGTWRYVGTGGSGSFTIRDFGAIDYYNLEIASSSGLETFNHGGTLTIAGSFTITSGRYNSTGVTIITGPTTVNGQYQYTTGAQTFSGGLSVNGTFTGGSGNSIVHGSLTIGGTASYTATSGTTFISGNFSKTPTATFNANGGTVTLNGTSGLQTFSPGGATFNNINHQNNSLVQMLGSLVVNGTFVNAGGTFDLNTHAITVNGVATLTAGTYFASLGLNTFNAGLNLVGTSQFIGSSGNVDVNGDFGLLSGNPSFTAPTGTLFVSGNFLNLAGTFNHNNGTVRLDGGNQNITGDTTFYNFIKQTAVQVTLTFAAGSTQTVLNNLVLNGSVGNLLFLRSSINDSPWNITPPIPANRNVQFVNVKDSVNTDMINIDATNSFNAGNNVRWFFASSASWIGVVSTDWEDLNNWDNMIVPGATDNVLIQAGTPFQPTLTTAAATADLFIVPGAVLTLAGHNFTVNGTFSNQGNVRLLGSETVTLVGGQDTDSGTWTYVAAGGGPFPILDFGADDYFNLVIEAGAGVNYELMNNLSVLGGLTITSGTLDTNDQNVAVAMNFTINGGAFLGTNGNVDIDGHITQTGGTFTAPAATLFAERNITFNGGTFNHNNGTVILNGVNQSITSNGRAFHHLTHNATGVLTLVDNLDVDGDFINMAGNVDATGRTLRVAGDWTWIGGSLVSAGSTLLFDGAAQNFIAGGQTYNHVTHQGTGTLTLMSPVIVAGNLTNTSGDLNLNGQTVNLGGNWTFAAGTLMAAGSTVNFTSAAAQNIQSGGQSFGSIDHIGIGTVLLLDNLTATGTVANSTGTFNLNGFILHTNHLTVTGGTFLSGSGTVDVDGNFNLSVGTFTATSGTMFVGGDFNHPNGIFNHANGTVRFDGTGQTITGNTVFFHFTKTTAVADTMTFEDGATQTILGTLTFSGALGQNLSLRSLNPGSRWEIDPQGSRSVIYVDVQDSDNINATTINAASSVDSLNNVNWFFSTNFIWTGMVSSDWGDLNNWDQASVPLAGDDVTIPDAASVMFSPILDMNRAVNNMVLQPGAVLDLVAFEFTMAGVLSNEGTIRLAGGQTLTGIIQDTDSGTWEYYGPGSVIADFGAVDYFNLLITGTGFTLGAGLTVANDLTINGGGLASGANTVNVNRDLSVVAGTFTASASAIDVNRHVILNTATFTATSGTFNVGGDFLITNSTFNANNGTVLFDGAAQALQSDGEEFHNITHQGTGTLSLLDDLDMNGSFSNVSGNLDAANRIIRVGGNWSWTAGTFNSVGSTVIFDGAVQSLTSGGQAFNHITHQGSNTLTLLSNLIVNGNLVNTSGDLNITSRTINIAGDWTWTGGTLISAGSTVIFDGGNQNLTSGGQSFQNITHMGAGTLTVVDDLDINGNFANSSGNFDMTNRTVHVGGHWTWTGGSLVAAGSTVVFDGAAQNLTSGGQSFHHLTHNGSAALMLIDDLDIDGNFTNLMGAMNATGRIIHVGGDWFWSSGFATTAGSTVIFDGTVPTQTVTTGGQAFNNVTHSGTSTLVLAVNPLVVNGILANSNGVFNTNNINVTAGTLNVSGGQFVGSAGNLSISGNVTVGAAGELTAPQAGSTFNVGGNWTVGSALSFLHNNGTVTFNGAGIQNVDSGSAPFHHLTHSGAGTVLLVGSPLIANGTITNSNGTFNTNALNVNAGALTVSAGTFTAINSLVTVTGHVTVSGTATLSAPTATMHVGGNWTIGAASNFVHNSGTVNFDGAGAQSLVSGGDAFFHLTHSGTGTLTLMTDNLTVADTLTNSAGIFDLNNLSVTTGHLAVSGGQFLANTLSLIVTGNVAISLTGTLTAPGAGAVFSVGGNWSNAASSTFNANGGTVTFNGALLQTLDSGGDPFENLSHTAANILRLVNTALTVNNVLDNKAGTFDTNGQNLTAGTLDISAGMFLGTAATITVFGHILAGFPTTFTASSTTTFIGGDLFSLGTFLHNNGTLNFNGAGDQTMFSFGATVNHLTHSGSATFFQSENLTALGTVSNTAGTFDPDGFHIIATGLTISGGTFLGSSGNLLIDGNVNISGTGTLIAPTGTFSVSGNWTNAATSTFNPNNATVHFNGAGIQLLTTNGDAFHHLNHSGTGTVQLVDAVVVNGTLTQSQGTWDAATNNRTTTVHGLATLSGGSYLAGSAVQTFHGGLTLSGTATFTGSTGNVDINGHLTMTAGTPTFTAPSATLFLSGNFNNTAGTFLHNGGTVQLDGGNQTISGSNTFNNLTKTTAVSVTLTFGASSTTTILGTTTLQGSLGQLLLLRSSSIGTQWNIDPQGDRNISRVNVRDSVNINVLIITAVLSTNAGNNIHWNFSTTVNWTGTVNSDWNNTGNWDLGFVPGHIDHAVIGPAANNPQFESNVSIQDLSIQAGGSLDLNGRNLTLTGNFSNEGMVRLRGTETVTGFLNDTYSGTWLFYGTNNAFSDTIYVKDFGFGADYFNIILQPADGLDRFVLGADLTVTNNFNVIGGIFQGDGRQMSIAGNATIANAQYRPGAGLHSFLSGVTIVNSTVPGTMNIGGSVTLNSTSMTATGSVSGNLTVNNGSSVSPNGNNPGRITVGGNLTFQSSLATYVSQVNGVTAGTNYDQIVVGGNVTLNNATLNTSLGFTPFADNVFAIIDNTGAQAVNGIFNGLPQGSLITFFNNQLKINYVGGTGNDVTLRLRPTPIIAVGADAGTLPQVTVYDTAMRTVRFSFLAYGEGFRGGVRVAVGDVNGDGVPDIITGIGTGAQPHVKVFNGITGTEIRSFFAFNANFQGGIFVASGDINGDGFDDIIVGADAGAGPHVKVFSGRDNSELASFYAYGGGFLGGVRVAAADVNGDGRVDIITGAGPGAGPHVKVFSGLNFAQLPGAIGSFFAFAPQFDSGIYVAGADINGDGFAEVVASAGTMAGPHVKAFQGVNAQEIASYFAYATSFTGGVRVGFVDFNGDGRSSLLTGPGPGMAPLVRIWNVENQQMLDEFFALNGTFDGGVFVAGSH